MTGSVRGALSNERPYRDRAHPNTPALSTLARRAHANTFPPPTAWAKSLRNAAHVAALVMRFCPPYES
jgi:hypothetical protein